MARDLYGYKNIRVLSLGTGEKQWTDVDPTSFDIATAVQLD